MPLTTGRGRFDVDADMRRGSGRGGPKAVLMYAVSLMAAGRLPVRRDDERRSLDSLRGAEAGACTRGTRPADSVRRRRVVTRCRSSRDGVRSTGGPPRPFGGCSASPMPR